MGFKACAGPREGIAQQDSSLFLLVYISLRCFAGSLLIRVSDTNTYAYPWDNIDNIHVSVSWEGMSRFNSSLSLKDTTVAFLPSLHPFPPDASWISPWAFSAHQSGRKLTQKKGKGFFCFAGKLRLLREGSDTSQSRLEGAGRALWLGAGRGVDQTSTFIYSNKSFAQTTALANLLRFSCCFVLQLIHPPSPLAPLHAGFGQSGPSTQFRSSWTPNQKCYSHNTRCWPGISSLYTIVIACAKSALHIKAYCFHLICAVSQDSNVVASPCLTQVTSLVLLGLPCGTDTVPVMHPH